MKRFLTSTKARPKSIDINSATEVIDLESQKDVVDEPKPKARRRLTRYNKAWETTFKWVTELASNPHAGYCTDCHTEVRVGHGGQDDLRKHSVTMKHQAAAKASRGNASIANHVQNNGIVSTSSQSGDAVTHAEAIFVQTLAATNSSFASADKWMSAIKAMFPQCTVAKKMQCGRSKSTAFAVELAKITQEGLLEALRTTPFTISTDGSNDMGCQKQFPLIVRTLVGGEVNSFILSVPCVTGSATGENIFNAVDATFAEHRIPWEKCLALGCDNANVMTGEKKGVLGCMRNRNPDMYLSGCCCHLVHIAAQKAAAVLPIDVEQMLVDTFYYLEGSSLRKADFRQLQIFHEVKSNKILKHVSTRWLSLKKCLPRLLENWDTLSDLVNQDLNKKGSGSRTERLLRMKTFLKSASNKLYTLFLTDALSPFDDFNTALQCAEPMIHRLRRKIISLIKALMHRFVKPCAMVGREVDSINYKDDFCLKSESDIIIADEAREFLEAAAMSCTEKREFFINVKLFFQTGIKYIQEKLPWNEETLFHLEVTDMGCGDRSSSLRFLLEKFPCLTPGGISKSQILVEYSKYLSMDPAQVPSSGRLDAKWEKIKSCQDEDGSPFAPNLCSVMQLLLTIPHSSAHCERIFSLVRQIKTDQRSCLGNDTLEALLVLKTNARKELSKEDLRRLKSSYKESLSLKQ